MNVKTFDKKEEIIKNLKKAQELDIESEEYYEYYREPLSIDTYIVKNIMLSWGGPSDGFKLYFDAESNHME